MPNSSAEWDFLKLRSAGAEGYPQMPVFSPPDAESAAAWQDKLRRDALPVVIEPGDLLALSGAHLHGSVPNCSGVARLSSEWRLVDETDLRGGHGAVNCDGGAPRTEEPLRWFGHAAESKRKLSR